MCMYVLVPFPFPPSLLGGGLLPGKTYLLLTGFCCSHSLSDMDLGIVRTSPLPYPPPAFSVQPLSCLSPKEVPCRSDLCAGSTCRVVWSSRLLSMREARGAWRTACREAPLRAVRPGGSGDTLFLLAPFVWRHKAPENVAGNVQR